MSRCSDLHSSNMQQPTFRTFISDIFVKLKVLVQLKFNVSLLLYLYKSGASLSGVFWKGLQRNRESLFLFQAWTEECRARPRTSTGSDGWWWRGAETRHSVTLPWGNFSPIILSVRNINVSKYFTQQFGFQNRNIKEWCIEIATMCSISPYHHELSVSYGPTTLHRWSVLWYFIPVTVCR